MNRYHWVLFDADHTLFDFDKASEEALSEVLAGHGVEWKKDMYADYKKINVQCWTEHEQGIIDRDTLVYQRFRRYFDFMQLDLDPVSTQHRYLELLGTKPYLMPGAERILMSLKEQVRLGYITNGMTIVQRRRLEKIGWHLHDIGGALSFGYNACWYNPGEEKCDLLQEPDFTIRHLDQLHAIVFG